MVATLGLAASARADVLFTGPGAGTGTTFGGFAFNPGNVLNVGGVQAIQNAIASEGGTGVITTPVPNQGQFTFQAYGQASVGGVLSSTSGGLTFNLPTGQDYTFVFGTTERVTFVGGTAPGTSSAFFGIVNPTGSATNPYAGSVAGPGGTSTAAPYVNYFEVWQGGVGANNLNGTGFNDGTRVLAGTFTGISQTSAVANSGPAGNLDQFVNNDRGSYQSVGLNGSLTLNGVVTDTNTAYFNGQSLNGSTFNFTTNLSDPFSQTDPSGAFLTGSTTTATGVTPTTAGAGLPYPGAGNSGPGTTGIGGTNGLNGPSVQVQFQSTASFIVNATTGGPPTPEPATLAVFAGVMGIGGLVYRRRKVA
jgi:hypothetical protein